MKDRKNSKNNLIEGVLSGNERGYAFLIPTAGEKEDYFIPHSDLRGAMHGDRVLCEKTDGTGTRTTARVKKILERGIDKLCGTYFRKAGGGGFVEPDDKKYFKDIYIPAERANKVKNCDKVIVKILSYPKNGCPEGLIIKILGKSFEKDTELKSIEYTYKLPEKFKAATLDAAEKVPASVSEKDLKGRKDLRNVTTVTIDGDNSKDFDDAISVSKTKAGNYCLGVHIADVSHYVISGSPLDKEAFERATSVYFPESVIPMLPEKLSNGICSLNEGVDRLTLSCIMTIDKGGKIVDREITPSVIKSKRRLTYNKVQKILDGDEELRKEYSDVLKDLTLAEELSDILSAAADVEGVINLDLKDNEIEVDKNGKINIKILNRDKAHTIIENFMIAANVTVAEFMFYAEQPCIYRVHGSPLPEKLEEFYEFLNGLGVKARHNRDGVYPKDFQKILKDAENTPAYPLINKVMLRSMQKAVYSPVDEGHFGLSKRHYCHFTSPIRRYPDLCVHRILKDFLSGAQDLDEKYGEFVYDAAKQSSEKERNALTAERAADDYYKLLYISDYKGEEFDAIISGVMNFGLFAELSCGVEGLIKVETLRGGRFVCDKKRYILSDGKTAFRLGEKIKIKVAGVNLSEKRAEFLIVDKG